MPVPASSSVWTPDWTLGRCQGRPDGGQIDAAGLGGVGDLALHGFQIRRAGGRDGDQIGPGLHGRAVLAGLAVGQTPVEVVKN